MRSRCLLLRVRFSGSCLKVNPLKNHRVWPVRSWHGPGQRLSERAMEKNKNPTCIIFELFCYFSLFFK